MDTRSIENMLSGMNISRNRKSTRPSRKPQSIYRPVKTLSKPRPKKTESKSTTKKTKAKQTTKKPNSSDPLQSIMNTKINKGNKLSVLQYLHSSNGKSYGLTKQNVGVYGCEDRFRKAMFTQSQIRQILSSASKIKKCT